jgi:hypothetical protein
VSGLLGRSDEIGKKPPQGGFFFQQLNSLVVMTLLGWVALLFSAQNFLQAILDAPHLRSPSCLDRHWRPSRAG